MRKFGRSIAIIAGLSCFLSSQMAPLLAHQITAPPGPAPRTTHTVTVSHASSSVLPGDPQLPANFALNLSSTLANLAASIKAPTQIFIGGSLKANGAVKGGSADLVTPGELLTPAQYVALQQIIDTGHQSLILNSQGSASAGFLTLDPADVTSLSSLTLPANVVLNSVNFTAQTPFTVSGQTQINGSLYATQVSKAATSFLNFGTLTLGSSGLISGTSLNLNIAGSLNNAGRIAASSGLAITSGGTIYNQGQANQPATIIGQSLNLSAASGNIVNSGLITATTGNINIASAGANDLVIENGGGTLQALSGAINFRDASYTGSANLSINGGNLLAQAINLYSGRGAINANVDNVVGTVNTYAGSAQVFSQAPNLTLGTIDITGDPTYYNIGNITINGDITVAENLAILATGNITTTSAVGQIATTGATSQAPNILIVAGASLSPACGTCYPTLSGNPPSSGSVTLDPTTPTGGNIDFTASSGLQISSSSTAANFNGGNIVLAAFSSGGTGGQVLLNSANGTAATITASGSGSGSNGSVMIIGGSTTAGTAINAGQIINNGGTGGGGNVTLITAQPTSSDGNPVIFDTTGTIISGNTIVPSTTITPGAGIAVVGNIAASGTVALTAGGNIQTPHTLAATITSTQAGLVKLSGEIIGSAVNPQGTLDFVASTNNAVYVISTAGSTTNQVIATLPLSAPPSGIAVSEDGTQVYVISNGTLSVITVGTSGSGTPTFKVTSTISGLTGGQYVVVNPSNSSQVFVGVAQGTAGTQKGTANVAYAVNVTTGKLTTIYYAQAAAVALGAGGGGLAINPSGTILYIGNLNAVDTNPGSVTAYNVAQGTVVATITVGVQPSAIAVNPSGTELYVTNTNNSTGATNGTVTVVNTNFLGSPTVNPVVTTITSSAEPTGVSFNPSGTLAYVTVTNPTNGNTALDVINTANNTILTTIPGLTTGTEATVPDAFYGNFAGFNPSQQPIAYFAGSPSTSVYAVSTANIAANQLTVRATGAGTLVQLTTSANNITVNSNSSAFITGSQLPGQTQTLQASSATSGIIQLGTEGSIVTTGAILARNIDLLATTWQTGTNQSSVTVSAGSTLTASAPATNPNSSLTINTPQLANNGHVSANGLGGVGIISIANDSGLTISTLGTITASQVTSTNGGDVYLFTSGTLTVATGTINANATGSNFHGGIIGINANSLVITGGTLTLNANATGVGSYGNVTVITTNQGAPGDLTIGSASGDLIIHANGNNNVVTSGVDLQAGRNLTIDPTDLTQLPQGLNAQGPQLSLVAGNLGSTASVIMVTGSLILNGTGSGAGGNLNIGSIPPNNANPGTLDITGSLSVNGGITGAGGQINISNNSATLLTLGSATTNSIAGTISANGGSTSGKGGNINIVTTGSGGAAITNGSDISLTVTSGVGGSLQVKGNSIVVNAGDLNANAGGAGAETGGNINLASLSTLFTGGNISANGSGSGGGGNISLVSSSATTFTIGAGAAINGVAGVISANGGTSAGAGGGSLFVQNTGTGGINIPAPSVNILLNPSALGGAGHTITLLAGAIQNGTFVGSGQLQIGGGSLSASATAGGNYNGGQLFLGGLSLSVGGTDLVLTANAAGTGNGGQVTILTSAATSNITVGTSTGDIVVNAEGGSAASTAGNGGTVTIVAGGNLIVTSTASLDAEPQGVNGSGANYSLSAGGPGAINPGNLLITGALDATGGGLTGAGTGNGGNVTLVSNSTTAFIIGPAAVTNGVTGAVTANSGTSGVTGNAGGTISVINSNTGGITVGSAGNLNVNGVNGAGTTYPTPPAQLPGAIISLSSPTGPISIGTSAGNSTISANATVQGAGGTITILGTSVTVTGTVPLTLNANGITSTTGVNGNGNGGQITITATGAGASLNLGSATGGIEATATGTSSGTATANGGSLSFLAGGNITVNTSFLNNEPLGHEGNGGHYLFAAGTHGPGNLSINNTLDASGLGGGTAGSIILEANSTSAFIIGASSLPVNGIEGTLTAAGTAGNIIVSNTGDAQLGTSLTLPGDGLEIVVGGNILTIAGAGVIDTSSTTSFGGNILLMAGSNVGFDAQQNIHITGPSPTGGKIDLTTGSAITGINAQSNDGLGDAGGDVILMALPGSVAGSGTIKTPTTVTITTNGSPSPVAFPSQFFNVGIFAGSLAAGTSISIGNINDAAGNGGPGNLLITAGTITVGDEALPAPSTTIFFGIWASHIDGSSGGEYQTVANGKANISVGSITTESGNISISGGGLILVNGTLNASGVTYDGTNHPGTGGTISITTPSTTAFIIGTGVTTNGVSGSIISNGAFPDATLTDGGTITIQTTAAQVTLNNATIQADGLTQGGSITISALSIKNPTTGLSTINADNLGDGPGGNISITITTTSGTLTIGTAAGGISLSANGGNASSSSLTDGTGGQISVVTAAGLAVNLAAITANVAGGSNGNGGQLTLTATGTMTLTGGSFSADDAGGTTSTGGTIAVTAGTITMPSGSIAWSANGTSGGSITVGTTASPSSLIVGTAPTGQMSFSVNGTNGAAGTLSVTTAGALTVNPSGGGVSDTATNNGNGANLTFGTASGKLYINGSLDASANGTGTGGMIALNAPIQNFFIIGTPSTNGGVAGTLTAQGGTGGTITINTGNTAMTIASPSVFNVATTGSGTGGNISITTAGTLTTAGGTLAANANTTSGATGGAITISALSITVSSGGPLIVSANGGSTGNGGTIDIITGRGPLGGGIGTNANQIEVMANGGSAGSVAGDGGTIELTNALNLAVNPLGIVAGPLGQNGKGASISFTIGGNLSIIAPLAANGNGTGDGGSITINTAGGNGLIIGTPGTFGIAALSAAAGATGGAGGKISVTASAGPLNLTNPSLLTVTATAGIGGTILLSSSTSFTIQTGFLTANAAGGDFQGGSITLTAGQFFINGGSLILGANASGAGDGGNISVTNTVSGNINIGSANGNFQINAMGGTGGGTPSASGNGGTVNISSAKNLNLDFGVVNADPIGTNGNGANLTFTAGTTGNGSLVAINSIEANGVGTGNGGTINLTSSSPTTFTIGTATSNSVAGTVSATGVTGGSVTIKNSYATPNQGITLTSASIINVAASNGTGGSISLQSANGTLTIAATSAMNVNGAGTGSDSGGSISLTGAGLVVTGGANLLLSADGVNTGNGGNISITLTGTSASSNIVIGTATGQVSLQATGGSIGSADGSGGQITLSTTQKLTINNPAASIIANPLGANGSGEGLSFSGTGTSSVMLITGSLNTNGVGSGAAGNLTLSVNSSTAFNIGAPTTNGITGQLLSSGTTGGAISITNTGTGGITVANAGNIVDTSSGGTGGSLTLQATGGPISLVGGSQLAVNAGGNGGYTGGTLSLSATAYKFSGVGPVTLAANGSGSGTGGNITIKSTATGTPGNFAIGSASGQFAIQATGGTGGSTPSNAGNGGNVTLTSAANITMNTTNPLIGLTINPLGTDGTGGNISITALNVAITGSLNVNAMGTALGDNGGNVTIKTTSSTVFTIGGTIGLNGITGSITSNAPGGTGVFAGNIALSSGGKFTINAEAGVPAEISANSNTIPTSATAYGTISFSNSSATGGAMTVIVNGTVQDSTPIVDLTGNPVSSAGVIAFSNGIAAISLKGSGTLSAGRSVNAGNLDGTFAVQATPGGNISLAKTLRVGVTFASSSKVTLVTSSDDSQLATQDDVVDTGEFALDNDDALMTVSATK